MSLMWVSLCLAMTSLLPTQAMMDIPALRNFQPDQFTGKWYGVAVASNCPEFMQMKPILKMTNIQITGLDNGDLELALGFPMEDKCMFRSMHYKMTAHGTYTETGVAQSVIKFVETDYTHSALEYTQQDSGNGELCHTVKLYAREREIPQKCLPHFSMLSNVVGLTKEDMLELPKEEDCDPSSS